MFRLAKEMGDVYFPLEANTPEDVNREHPQVGKKAEVTSYANESLSSLRGKAVTLTGVILKHGQIAGYEVKHEGKTLYGPKKDFFIEYAMVEDVHLNSPWAEYIRGILSHYTKGGQHDYYGPSWDGIEAFHFQLAKGTNFLAMETAGFYKYPTSLRADMDGKDWRLLIPDPQSASAVAVNCHSLRHDGVWTLSTTVFSTREVNVDILETRGHPDHWHRTLLWTQMVAEMLTANGYDYSDIQEINSRLKKGKVLRQYADRLIPLTEKALQILCGYQVKLKPVSLGFSRCRIQPNHVGRYEHPSDECPYGILTVHPKAWGDQNYLYEVVKHELIHHALGHLPGDRSPHDKYFKQIAKALNLPEKWRG